MGERLLFVRDSAPTPEQTAAWRWLRRAAPAQLVRRLSDADVVWLHGPCHLDQLRSWITAGGRLLLSLQATALLHELGLENRLPDRLGMFAWQHTDTELTALEGERRGAIGFGPHPIFDGLQLGPYVLQPTPGAQYPEAVYVGRTAGRVVAVERQYLALDASRNIVLEHRLGAGRVLSVGAHLLFAELDNPYRLLLERFALNCLRYLLRAEPAGKDCYWPGFGATNSGLGGDIDRTQPIDVVGPRIQVVGDEVWSLPVRLAHGLPRPVSVAIHDSEAALTYDCQQLSFEVDLRYFWPYPEGVLGMPRLRRRAGQLEILDGMGVKRGSLWFDPWPARFQLNGSSVWAEFDSKRQVTVSFRGVAKRRSQTEEPLLRLETPDGAFNEEFALAVEGLRAFDVDSPAGRGLAAGFGKTGSGWWSGRLGYAWYFGRDMMWSALGCLGVGLREPVRESLRLLARHQQLDGKILHELTPAGVADFTAADSTPLFLVGLERYLQWTGDLALVRELWPNAKAALAFCRSTDRDGDGLVENTGIGHGWSEGGRIYGAHATFYLNACWAAALSSMSALAMAMGEAGLVRRCRRDAAAVRRQLNRRFFMREAGWFAAGIDRDGALMPARTIEPAVAALFGLLEPKLTVRFFDELASARYTAPWGVRYIANDDPAYHPRGYHHGSVWPLFTGWAATAEYAYGRPEAAFRHLRSSLALGRREPRGCIPEVLDGDTGAPAGVCPHQLWSHALTVLPVVEGLLGLRPLPDRLLIHPQLPPTWNYVRVSNLRVGTETLSFTYSQGQLELTSPSTLPIDQVAPPIWPASTSPIVGADQA